MLDSIFCIPYTYRIKWSSTGMNYYGVRYSKNCNPNDFWKTYFTSSKYVENYRKIYGDPDIIQIRKIFISENRINDARNWENKVLRRLDVLRRGDFLNKSNNKGIDPILSSKARTGISPGNKGLPQPEYIKQKKRKPKKVVICPHCQKSGGISAMYRHHFDKCGSQIDPDVISKLIKSNKQKSHRAIVQQIHEIRKMFTQKELRHINKQLCLKPGWYQLSDEVLHSIFCEYKNYLSSRKVLNLGNLSE